MTSTAPSILEPPQHHPASRAAEAQQVGVRVHVVLQGLALLWCVCLLLGEADLQAKETTKPALDSRQGASPKITSPICSSDLQLFAKPPLASH